MIAMDDDEDEDNMTLYMDVKAKISAQRMRVATVKAQAQPFGSNDAWEIVRAIKGRFEYGGRDLTIEDKRAMLADVVERIRITGDCKAAFVVRGGLPLQRAYKTGDFSGKGNSEYFQEVTNKALANPATGDFPKSLS